MPWRVDKTGAKIAAGWDPKGKDKASQDNWNLFMNEVNRGKHPSEAGKNMTYKLLNVATGQAQIRLSGSERASFIVDEKQQVVNKVQLGGHT
jgi:hypothetical protein